MHNGMHNCATRWPAATDGSVMAAPRARHNRKEQLSTAEAGRRRVFEPAPAVLAMPLGLGAVVSGATHVTDGMLLAAAEAVAGQVDVSEPGASLLPPVDDLRASSATVAVAVASAAEPDGVATRAHDDLVQAVQEAMWQPVYPT